MNSLLDFITMREGIYLPSLGKEHKIILFSWPKILRRKINKFTM